MLGRLLILLTVLSPALVADEGALPVHADVPALERAAGAALVAYARDDAAGVAEALEIVAAQVRVLKVEEQERYGNVVGYSRSFEVSNNLAREYADGEMLDQSYEQYVWVMKGCRTCHTIAIEAGVDVHAD